MKRRIISLVLALTMLCAMAISVSATTYEKYGSYTGSTGTCEYYIFGNFTSTQWSTTIEFQSYTDSYLNYLFKVDVYVWPDDGFGGFNIPEPHYGVESTRIASNGGTCSTAHHTDVNYYINSTKVDSKTFTF